MSQPFDLPPPPPPSRSGKGCLKAAAIGCGAVAVLFVLAIAASTFWVSRNKGSLQEGMKSGVAAGQRFGAGTDEAGCEAEAKRRAAGTRSITAQMGIGAFFRACLESSRETPGFCENVPPPTAIRRTVEWQRTRCGSDLGCAQVVPVIQTYCADDRPKRTGLDSTAAAPDSAAPPDSATADSTGF